MVTEDEHAISFEQARAPLPTPYGTFEIRAFEQPSGHIYVAMVLGTIADGDDILVRLHSECLTGDVLGSLRCDCGVQLRTALRTIAAERRGVLLYVIGHEGRGIGLLNKLRAYVAQDEGADTVDANTALGLPIDSRDFTDAAAVLAELEVRTIRLLTNNPVKVRELRAAGVDVRSVVPLPSAPHLRNLAYLTTKATRLGHVSPTGAPLQQSPDGDETVDVMELLGPVRARQDRPFVALKYAQTLDGRIATSTGDARWISGEAERRVSHALRAACDGVMVGVGTIVADQPQLTVRSVSGASPTRIVLDSGLRLPMSSRVLDIDAPTTIITTARSDPDRRRELQGRGVRVEVVAEHDGRVDLGAALARLRSVGMDSILVEGGASVITSLLAERLVDRIIAGVAPIVIGDGTQAVGALGVTRIADGIHLTNRAMFPIGDDVVLAWDVQSAH